jgi:6,7-dimethyl-8-ribityllumazine synthase
VNTIEQALERSKDDETNVGYSSATTALEMVSILNQGSVTD